MVGWFVRGEKISFDWSLADQIKSPNNKESFHLIDELSKIYQKGWGSTGDNSKDNIPEKTYFYILHHKVRLLLVFSMEGSCEIIIELKGN